MAIVEKLFEFPADPRQLELPSNELAEARIMLVLDCGTADEMQAGLDWYINAHTICKVWADNYGLPSHEHVAGIIAALSPQRAWEDNLVSAQQLLEGADIPHLSHAIESAQQIRAGAHPTEVLYLPHKNNLKVRAFYENMADPFGSDAVTVDRHVLGVLVQNFRAIQEAGRYITPSENAWAQGIFRDVAGKMDVRPNQLQAAVWVIWKRLRGDKSFGPDLNQLVIDFDALFEE